MTNTATRLITLIFLLQNQPNQKAAELLRHWVFPSGRSIAILECSMKWVFLSTQSADPAAGSL